MSVDLYSQTQFYLKASKSCQSLHFQREQELTCFCVYVHFFDVETKKNEMKKSRWTKI